MRLPLLIAVRLSKEGFGSTQDILRAPVDVVLAQLEFCTFQRNYDEAVADLNAPNETR
jgi:hypothetical protein